MKTMAAVIAGVLLSVVTFAAGAFGALLYLSAPEPTSVATTAGVSDLWTANPTVVARNNQQLERVDGRPISVVLHTGPESAGPDTETEKAAASDIAGDVLTGSIAAGEDQHGAALPPEHVEWCMARYSSYRAEDGTYQPYNGKRRHCISPYMTVESNVSEPEAGAAEEVLLSAHRALGNRGLNGEQVAADLDDHNSRCSKRYRSYRPEDNTYQPFDGGPRRPCR